MDKSIESLEIRSLQLALHEDVGVDYLNEAAALLRELAAVRRVRVDPHQFRLEILYRHPARGLLQEIHQALLTASAPLPYLRTH